LVKISHGLQIVWGFSFRLHSVISFEPNINLFAKKGILYFFRICSFWERSNILYTSLHIRWHCHKEEQSKKNFRFFQVKMKNFSFLSGEVLCILFNRFCSIFFSTWVHENTTSWKRVHEINFLISSMGERDRRKTEREWHTERESETKKKLSKHSTWTFIGIQNAFTKLGGNLCLSVCLCEREFLWLDLTDMLYFQLNADPIDMIK
jgi:hypothetical protein